MKLYSVKEAAKLVGVSTNTLYKYLDEDRIHAARGSAIQGRFRIPESALEEFLGIKLSKPVELVEAPVQINQDKNEESVAFDDSQQDEEIPITQETVTTKTPNRLPLKIVRLLLLLALATILVDLFIAKSVSLPAQLSRLFFILIMILLSYQEGGYRRG